MVILATGRDRNPGGDQMFGFGSRYDHAGCHTRRTRARQEC
jgi:hypothetical protein